MGDMPYDRLASSNNNAKRIAYVEQCFGNAGIPLSMTSGRVLVGEGLLTKICRKKPKQRQFFLFNDILVYGSIVINKKKFNKQHIIELEDVTVTEAEPNGNLRFGFTIKSPKKSFTVYTITESEKSEWMSHINRCARDCQAKRGGRGARQEEASPVWVPDAYATVCMHCRSTNFTVINRRHHCRKCGSVVCSNCSNKRWLMPTQSNKPLRVCLTCYNKLSAASACAAGSSSQRNDGLGFDCTESDDDDATSSEDSDGESEMNHAQRNSESVHHNFYI